LDLGPKEERGNRTWAQILETGDRRIPYNFDLNYQQIVFL
jgi:hypothetical protein